MPQTDPPDERTLRRRRELGDRVRILRERRKLAQGTLAHSAGMQRSTLQRIEYGQTAVSIDRLWALADKLGVHVTSLLSDDWASPGWRDRGGEKGGAPMAKDHNPAATDPPR